MARSKSRDTGRRARAPSPDPFDLVLRPPRNETREEKLAREEREERARQISKAIDNELKAEKAALKKEGNVVKVLILGQSYSGKSTTLKNIQMTYGKEQWELERSTWRTVILLNLLRGVNTILDALQDLHTSGSPEKTRRVSTLSAPEATKHQSFISTLGSLKGLQTKLEAKLGAAAIETGEGPEPTQLPTPPQSPEHETRGRQEFSVTSNTVWKRALSLKRKKKAKESAPEQGCTARLPLESFEQIARLAGEINALWQDPTVKSLIVSEEVVLEDSAIYFLRHTERVTGVDYDPSDEDVLHARLRTTGIQEYRFRIGRKPDDDWRFFDFNGSRSHRSSWYSFFDDVNAVLFLAPIDCYDQIDSDGVNKLQDSLLLWRTLCSNKLLSKIQSLILLLNKCDLLSNKLEGSNAPSVSTFFPNFKRPNDLKSVQSFFRTYFKEIHAQYSPERRDFICHFTSVVVRGLSSMSTADPELADDSYLSLTQDNHATAVTLTAVKDVILTKYLEKSKLL